MQGRREDALPFDVTVERPAAAATGFELSRNVATVRMKKPGQTETRNTWTPPSLNRSVTTTNGRSIIMQFYGTPIAPGRCRLITGFFVKAKLPWIAKLLMSKFEWYFHLVRVRLLAHFTTLTHICEINVGDALPRLRVPAHSLNLLVHFIAANSCRSYKFGSAQLAQVNWLPVTRFQHGVGERTAANTLVVKNSGAPFLACSALYATNVQLHDKAPQGQHKVLDSDNFILHVQERLLQRQGNDWRKAFYLPAAADTGVNQFRRRVAAVCGSWKDG